MSAPLKAIVPVVLVRTTLVPVVTAPVKVAPPEFNTVTEPIFVAIVRRILTTPELLMMRFAGQLSYSPKRPVSIPATEPNVIKPVAVLLPKVNVTPLERVMSPKIIGFIPKSTVVLAPTKRVVPAKFTPQSAPLQSVTVDLVKFPAITFVPA